MKDLVLDKDFEEWDWTSTKVRKAAYTAITTQLLTTNMNRKVWNDMVDKLNGVIEGVGLVWDGKYATLEWTKINALPFFENIPMAFFAYMFNSFVYNLTKLNNTTWRWEYDKAFNGFIGRTYHKGYLEDNTEADIVYGSLFYELGNRLNTLIRMMKDEALMPDLTASTELGQTEKVTLVEPDYSRFIVNWTDDLFKPNASVSFLEPYDLKAGAYNESNYYAAPGLYYPDRKTKADLMAAAIFDATLAIEEKYANLYSKSIQSARQSGELMIDYKSRKPTVRYNIDSSTEALLVWADLSKFMVSITSEFTSDPTLRLAFISDCVSSFTGCSDYVSNLEVSRKRLINAKLKIKQEDDATFELLHSGTFSSITQHYANIRGRISGREFKRMTPSRLQYISSQQSLLNIAKRLYGEPEKLSYKSYETAKMFTDENIHTENDIYHYISEDSDISAYISTIINSRVEHVEKDSGYMQRLRVADPTGTDEKITSTISASMSFGKQEEMITDIENTIETISTLYSIGYSGIYADDSHYVHYMATVYALRYEYYPTIDSGAFATVFDLSLNNSNPLGLETNAANHSVFDIIMKPVDASNTMVVNAGAFETITDIEISNIEPIVLETDAVFEMDSSAMIDFDPSSWRLPVKTDDVLELFQVYGDEKKDDELKLE